MKYLMFFNNGDFSISSFIFTIIFFIVICFIMIEFMLAVTRWSYNNKQPITSEFAIVKSKRKDSINNTYFITFELGSAQRIEYQVNSREYAMIYEEARGLVESKGSRFIKFRIM